MREVLRMRDPPRPNMHKGDLMKFEKALKGIKVEPTHRGSGVVRRYKVMGLSRTQADKTFFEGENGRISVADYFQGINFHLVAVYYHYNFRQIWNQSSIPIPSCCENWRQRSNGSI